MILSFIVLVVLLTILFKVKYGRMYEMASKVPSFNADWPLIGSSFEFFGANEESLFQLVRNFSYESISKGGLMKSWFGPQLIYVMTDAKDLEVVTKSQLNKSLYYDTFQTFAGTNIINAPVPMWKDHRKAMMRAFTPKMIDQYIPLFIDNSKKLVEKLCERVNTGEFELFPYVSAYEFDIVCETTFGVKVNSQDDTNHPCVVNIGIIMRIACDRLFRAWQGWLGEWIFKLTPQYTTLKEARKVLNEFILQVIKAKREEMKKNKEKINDNNASLYPSFLELVLSPESEVKYTDKELMQDMIVMIIAGTDTSTATICFACQILAIYPEMQKKVYQELYGVLGDSDRLLEKEDLPKLRYLDRILKETLRLYGPAAITGRKIDQDIQLPSGYTLPAGAAVNVCIYGVHRNPKYWGPEPEKFDPDRFLPENYDAMPPCSYMPFSYGPRNCPGIQFANYTTRIAVADIVRKFKLIAEPAKDAFPKLDSKMNTLAMPGKGVKVSLVPRK
ncbi:unnamed protein product [Chilo suppressalis]|uniref:Cytochrome P450 n=1 Tax=Chilo suppressalis TaxID=168631 RepID=A0ABN8BCD9_CHISP|nr:unnamed protein product [Chilo suppressalis]